MADDLLDNYNPLYDVHLQQYFSSPHMQKHLRSIGLLRDRNENELNNEGDNEVYARHNVMMNMMLKNREKQLAKLATLQKKLDAAEKVEVCRKIRSGQTPGAQARARPSRSLSRGRKAGSRTERRSSTSTDEKDWIRKIENESEDSARSNSSVYGRLSASVGKYRYLHKLDDHTLSAYMEELRKQLRRLERFRDVSFGPHSVARHPSEPQESWFFRRRSLPSFSDSGHANSVHEHLRKIRSGQFENSSPPRKLNEPNDTETQGTFAGGKQHFYRLPKIRGSDQTSTVNKNSDTILLPVNRSSSKPRPSRSTSKKRNEPVRVQRPKLTEDEALEVVGTTVLSNERNKQRETVKAINEKAAKTKATPSPIKRKAPSAETPLINLEMVGSSAVPASDTFVKIEPEQEYIAASPEAMELQDIHKEEDIDNDLEEHRKRTKREVMAERSGQSSAHEEEAEDHELDEPLDYKASQEEEHNVTGMEEEYNEGEEKPPLFSPELQTENEDEESVGIRSDSLPRPDSAISSKSIEKPDLAILEETISEKLEEAERETPTEAEGEVDQKEVEPAEMPSEDEAVPESPIKVRAEALLEAVSRAPDDANLYSSEIDERTERRNETYIESKPEETAEEPTAENDEVKDMNVEDENEEKRSENEEEIEEKRIEILDQTQSPRQEPEGMEEQHSRAKRSIMDDDARDTAEKEIVEEPSAEVENADEVAEDADAKSSSEHDKEQEDNRIQSPARQSEQELISVSIDTSKIQEDAVQDLPKMLVESEMKMASVDDTMELGSVEDDDSEGEEKPRVLSPSLPETLEDGTSLATEREPLTKDKWDEILSEKPEDYIVMSQTTEENAPDKPPNGFETALSDLLTSDHNGSAELQMESGELANKILPEETNAEDEEIEVIPSPVALKDLDGSKEIDTFAISSSPQQGELHPTIETEESEIVEAQASTPFFEGTVTATLVAEDNDPEHEFRSAESPNETNDGVSNAAASPTDLDRKLSSENLEVNFDVDNAAQIEEEKQASSPVSEKVGATCETFEDEHPSPDDKNLSPSHPEELTEDFYAKETFEDDGSAAPEEAIRPEAEEEPIVKEEAHETTQVHISEESSPMQDQAVKEDFRSPSARDEEENTSTDTEGADEDVASDFENEKNAKPQEEAHDEEKTSLAEASIVAETAEDEEKHSPSQLLINMTVDEQTDRIEVREPTPPAESTEHDALASEIEEHNEEEFDSHTEVEKENTVAEPEDEPIEEIRDVHISDDNYQVITAVYSESRSNGGEVKEDNETDEQPKPDYVPTSDVERTSQVYAVEVENAVSDENTSHTANGDHQDEHAAQAEKFKSLETHITRDGEENGASFGKTSAIGASDEEDGEKGGDDEKSDMDSALHSRLVGSQENVSQHSANGMNGAELQDENERTPSKAESVGGMAQINDEHVNGKQNGAALAGEHLIQTISAEHLNGTGESKI